MRNSTITETLPSTVKNLSAKWKRANGRQRALKRFESTTTKLLTAEEQSLKLEQKLYSELKNKLADYIEDLKNAAYALGTLDALCSLAQVAKQRNYVRPQMAEKGKTLDITGGRHPVVEAVSDEQFVPNDCYMDSGENRTLILTGPNMAGETLMAHIGSFVPAKSAMIPLTDKIFTRIGASDNLISDQSTFMVEMNEVAGIIRNATQDSLLILDEIGRGTSTFDGLSIAWSVVEYITKNIRAKTRFGIEVAALAGVPKEVTDYAKTVLKRLEKNDLTLINEEESGEEPKKSEVERLIKETDINNLTPLQAFNFLQDLKEKVE